MPRPSLDADIAARIAELAMAGIEREYPNKPGTVLASDEDLRRPRDQTPIFYGCFDWHSAVHSHWTLVRLLRHAPDAPWAAAAGTLLDRQLTRDGARAELAYLERATHRGFEMPYGIAWLLMLCAELHAVAAEVTGAATWRDALAELGGAAGARFTAWLRSLPFPIRSGQHAQSAFAMAFALEAAHAMGDQDLAAAVRDRAVDFYDGDRDAPVHYEPSAYDFLSPSLAEADLMRRALSPDAFATWLAGFLPRLDSLPLQPVACADPKDGKLAHFAGLNASRAWMLEGIASALPAANNDRAALVANAEAHGAAAIATLTHGEYAVTHWVGSFVAYYLTRDA